MRAGSRARPETPIKSPMSWPAWAPPGFWPGRRGAACRSWTLWCSAATAPRPGEILIRRAGAMWILGRNAEVMRDAQAAIDLLSGTGDLVWQARALHYRAWAYLALGDIERTDRDYAQVETLWATCGQHLEYAMARQERGVAAHVRGDLPTALAYLDDAQTLFDQLGVFKAELVVDKCTVLLAAGLARDALREVDAAVSTIERNHGSAARHAELLYSAALAAAATGDFSLAQSRSAEALRLFRRQQRPWWAARAELALLLCRFAGSEEQPAGLLPAARRVTARLAELDAARAVDAHLLTGRLALAQGRHDEAGQHLRSAAAARHGTAAYPQRQLAGPGDLVRGGGPRSGHAGRVRPRPGSAGPAPADAGRHRAAHAGHRLGRGAGGNGIAPRGPPGRRPAVPEMERTLAGHGAPGHPGAPVRRQRPGG